VVDLLDPLVVTATAVEVPVPVPVPVVPQLPVARLKSMLAILTRTSTARCSSPLSRKISQIATMRR